jgi:hypothetical protein
MSVRGTTWCSTPLTATTASGYVPGGTDASTASVSVALPEPKIVCGSKVASIPAGRPWAASMTSSLKPPSAVVVTVVSAVLPASALSESSERATEKSPGGLSTTSWPMVLLTPSLSVAIKSPVGPGTTSGMSAPPSSTRGAVPSSKRSAVPNGAAMPAFVLAPKNATASSSGPEVVTDGAVTVAASPRYAPLEASTGFAASTPE